MAEAPQIAVLATAALGVALGGCSNVVPQPSGKQAAIEAAKHNDRQYLVSYGQFPYRVNVQFVNMLDQSVIAVRRGAGEAAAENWPTLTLPARHEQPSNVPFESGRYEKVALDIAEAVAKRPDVCPGGFAMDIHGEDGEVSTMFRDQRNAWVIFGRCAKTVGS